MLPRIAILIAFFAFLSDARAQFFSPGMGMGGQCPYPFQMAPQIVPQNYDQQQRRLEDKLAREDAQAQADDYENQIENLDQEIARAKAPIYGRLRGSAAEVVFRHMQHRGDGRDLVNCDDIAPNDTACAGSEAPASYDPQEVERLKDRVNILEKEKAAPPSNENNATPDSNENLPPATNQRTGVSNTRVNCQRMPAQDASLTGKQASKNQNLKAANSDAGAQPIDDPDQFASGSRVYCVGGHNLWIDHYGLPDGQVNPEICERNDGTGGRSAGIQYPKGHGNIAACKTALDTLSRLYAKRARLVEHRQHARSVDDAYASEGRPRLRNGRNTGSSSLGNQVMGMLQRLQMMRNGGVQPGQYMGGYPYSPGSTFAPMNYNAFGGGPFANNGYYGAFPGGVPNGSFCNNMMNQNMFGNPYLNSLYPPWGNGAGPWGFPSGPQIRPIPGMGGYGGIPGMAGIGSPQVRPIPYMNGGMPGMPGLPGSFGAPAVRPLGNFGMPSVPGTIPGMMGMPPSTIGLGGVGGAPIGAPSIISGGVMSGTLPPAATLGGQLGYGGTALGSWGGGAIPSLYTGYPGAYVGAGVGATYTPGYFNMPSLGGAPKVAPLGPY